MFSLSKRIPITLLKKRFNSTLISTTTKNESNNLTRDSTTSTSTTSTSNIQEELKKLLEDNERVRNILLQQYPTTTTTTTTHRAPLPVLSITAKKNNTFASISTRDYRVLKSVSAGLFVQGASRGSVEGGSRVGLKIAQLTVEKIGGGGGVVNSNSNSNSKDLILKLRGFAGRGRDAAVRSILQHPGLNVVSIVDASRVQHGGCKPRKVRRV